MSEIKFDSEVHRSELVRSSSHLVLTNSAPAHALNLNELDFVVGRALCEDPKQSRKHRLNRTGYALVKRSLDISLTLILTILLLPVMALIALAIRLDSRGPVFFVQNRPGYKGKPFGCLKFRTMVINAEEILASQSHLAEEFGEFGKIRVDPRVTRVGAFLRKTSLDELPQLFNILIGHMSVVGPRPIVWAQVEQFGPNLNTLHSVKPGLAGLWQVCGRSDTTMDERIAMDLDYVSRASLRLDASLVVRTALIVLKKDGAY